MKNSNVKIGFAFKPILPTLTILAVATELSQRGKGRLVILLKFKSGASNDYKSTNCCLPNRKNVHSWAGPALAEEPSFLKVEDVNLLEILPSPPAPDSAATKVEIAAYHAFEATRTED